MAFKGITFAGQNVTPKNDGGLYQAHYGDGILWGCSMSLSGDDLVIQSGEFIMGGRVVQVDGATNVDLSGRTLTTGYIQVIMNADMTQGEGSQWYTSFVESATTTFPALTTDDINDTGNLYQLQLAVVQISGGNLTSITSYSPYSPVLVMNENGNALRMYYLNDDTFRIGSFDSSGSSLEGISTNTGGNAILFANGKNVIIRPLGIGVSGNQVQFDTNGQQIGGHPVGQITKASTSVSGGVQTQITETTGLSASGVYLISAKFTYTASSATAHVPTVALGNSYNNASVVDQKYIVSTSDRRMAICGICTGYTAYRLFVSTQASAINATVKDAVMDVVRLS